MFTASSRTSRSLRSLRSSRRSRIRLAASCAALGLLAVGATTGCSQGAKDGTHASRGGAMSPAAGENGRPAEPKKAEAEIGDIAITGGWVREPARPTVAAAYMDLYSDGPKVDALLSASSPVAGKTEVHEIVKGADGVEKMQQVGKDGVAIPAHDMVHLKPGGLHIMLLDVKQPLKPGDKVAVTLTFKLSGTGTVELPVIARKRKSGGSHGNDSHGHGSSHHGLGTVTNPVPEPEGSMR